MSAKNLKLPKKELTHSDWILIIANLLPLYGVWFLQWSAWEIFAVYSLETVLIGFFTILKLLLAVTAKDRTDIKDKGLKKFGGAVFLILFFILHYGIFVGVQMGIFLGVSEIGHGHSIGVLQFFLHPNRYLSNDAGLMIGLFIIGYGYKNMVEFIQSGRYKTAPLMTIMFEPYGRIFVQQLTVIAGSLFLVFGAGKIFITVFTAVKIYVSVFIDFSNLVTKKMEAAVQESKSSHS